jgi:hypothetical protein
MFGSEAAMIPCHAMAVACLSFALFAATPTETPESRSTPNLDCIANHVDRKHDLAGERQRLIMAELLRIGHALACYAEDHRSVPGPTGGLQTLEILESRLSPTYIGQLLSTDAWGTEYRFWSNGVECALISFGSDGSPEFDYDAVLGQPLAIAKNQLCGVSGDPSRDIVYLDWNLCRVYKNASD